MPGLPLPILILSTILTGVTKVVALVINASFELRISLMLKLDSLNLILCLPRSFKKVSLVIPGRILFFKDDVLRILFLSKIPNWVK